MAYQADNTLITNREMLGDLLAKPFVALFNALTAMAERDSRLVRLRALAEMSEEELAANGTTRREETARIMGGRFI